MLSLMPVQPDFSSPERLVDGVAHLWEIVGSPEWERYLNSTERERWLRITDEESRQGYATSQGGLRKVLSYYLGVSPEDVNLYRRERGKPFVEGGPEFNLSNTLGRTFVVVSRAEVGLDLEGIERKVRADELADKFYFPDEAAACHRLPHPDKERLFLRLWVRKEAMVKLSGEGIYIGLRDARVRYGHEALEEGDYRRRKVFLSEFRPDEQLVTAVASWERLQVKCFFRI